MQEYHGGGEVIVGYEIVRLSLLQVMRVKLMSIYFFHSCRFFTL